ncbi:MAG: hypothetical protein ACI4VL_00020 [Bacilli bacterium]
MKNMNAKFGEKIKVTAAEEIRKVNEYKENLIADIIDKYLDVFEEGLNNGFSEFNINCPDNYKEAAIDELNKIFENTPYYLYKNINGLCFWPIIHKDRADYFNYLMYLKDKYENEVNNKSISTSPSSVRVLKPQHHSDR